MFEGDYRIKGKHAAYMRFLNAYTRTLDKTANVAGIFAIAVDVYMVAPLIGVAYNMRSPEDTSSDDTLNILSSQRFARQKDLDTVYRLVMLSEKSCNISADDRIDRAFRDDENPEKLAVNMDLFHQYMRGGVEWLYTQVTDGATTQEDYLVRIVELVNQYRDDFNIEKLETSDLDFPIV